MLCFQVADVSVCANPTSKSLGAYGVWLCAVRPIEFSVNFCRRVAVVDTSFFKAF